MQRLQCKNPWTLSLCHQMYYRCKLEHSPPSFYVIWLVGHMEVGRNAHQLLFIFYALLGKLPHYISMLTPYVSSSATCSNEFLLEVPYTRTGLGKTAFSSCCCTFLECATKQLKIDLFRVCKLRPWLENSVYLLVLVLSDLLFICCNFNAFETLLLCCALGDIKNESPLNEPRALKKKRSEMKWNLKNKQTCDYY